MFWFAAGGVCMLGTLVGLRAVELSGYDEQPWEWDWGTDEQGRWVRRWR